VRPTPQAAVGHSAGLVEQAVAALHPLTQPRTAEPCEKAMAVAEVLHECFSKLLKLQVVPRARAKSAPKVRESKKGRVELMYAGVGWNPERVRELRTQIEEAELMPYGDIKQYIVDSVASDRQFSWARSYLSALYDASQIDGTMTFNGNLYTSQQLRSSMPKLRSLHIRRRQSIVKFAGFIFGREGTKNRQTHAEVPSLGFHNRLKRPGCCRVCSQQECEEIRD
jgi:hypothetical protein